MDVESMSMKEMKDLIKSAGLGFSDCVEKADMQARAREAKARLVAASSSSSSSSSSSNIQKEVQLSGFSSIMAGPPECLNMGEQPDLMILILHGLGASNTNFTDLPGYASSLCTSKKVVWVFPQAEGQGWWELDVMKWIVAMQQGEAGIAALIREEPAGLKECRVRMKTLLAETSKMLGGLPFSRMVLGGFSQGAMTAMDLALHLDDAVAGVTMLSGAPIVVDQWAARLAKHQGIKVFMSHGQADQVLPFVASGWARGLLEQGGAQVIFEAHGGGHELGQTTFPSLVSFWSSL